MTTATQALAGARPRTAAADAAARLAGLGGLVFLVLVVVQNVLKAATNPSDTATPAQVLHFAQHDAWTVHLLVVTYVIGFPALFLFASGLAQRATELAPGSEIWARLGRSSVVVIAVLFGLVNILQVALVADRSRLAGDPAVVSALWTLHNAVFTMNLLAVGGALLGLGRAAALAGLVPRRLGQAAVAGACLLAVAAAPAVAEVHGSKLLALGLVGFLCWLAFVATAAVRLLGARAS
ncbi:MAG TPA: hypothetical protein VHC67_11910 [Gaiellaceae bacterium]|jgi:hypothetical protein|nr:hypothetical protein [Gaiellaceae bacterium]